MLLGCHADVGEIAPDVELTHDLLSDSLDDVEDVDDDLLQHFIISTQNSAYWTTATRCLLSIDYNPWKKTILLAASRCMFGTTLSSPPLDNPLPQVASRSISLEKSIIMSEHVLMCMTFQSWNENFR